MRKPRQAPYDQEAEQGYLGSCLLDNLAVETGQRVFGAVGEGCFYNPAHKLIWAAMRDMRGRVPAVPLDLTTLAAELETRGQLAQVGDRPYLAALLDAVPTAAHAEHYAEIIAAHHLLRQLAAIGTEVTEAAYGFSTAPEGPVEYAKGVSSKAKLLLQQAADTSLRRAQYTSMKEAISEARARVEGFRKSGPPPASVITTGIYALDQLTGGVPRVSYGAIAAPTSVGKTALAMQFVRGGARHGIGGLYISLEMGRCEMQDRYCQMEAPISSRRLRSGSINDEQYHRLLDAWNRLEKLPIRLICPEDLGSAGMAAGRVTPSIIRDLVRPAAAEESLSLGIVVVDYIGLMKDDVRNDNRVQELGEISHAMKRLSGELGICVIVVCQFNRSNTQSEDKRPQLEYIRDTGEIANDADWVWMPHRPGYYRHQDSPQDADSPHLVEAEVHVKKARNDKTGVAKVFFQPTYARFCNGTGDVALQDQDDFADA